MYVLVQKIYTETYTIYTLLFRPPHIRSPHTTTQVEMGIPVCCAALTWVGTFKGTIRHVDHAHNNEHSNGGIDTPADNNHKQQQLQEVLMIT